MANRIKRVSAQVSSGTRELILRMVRPQLPQVFCQNVTYAYGVGDDYPFPSGPLTAVITGVHRTEAHEALVCTVAGETHRPDGKPFHITLSTAVGVAPVSAGTIDMAQVTPVEPITFEIEFVLDHARQQKPEPLKLAA